MKAAAPEWDCGDLTEAASFPPAVRFHVFTDGRLKPDPRYNDRYGSIAAGGVIIDADGHPRRKFAKTLGMGTNQEAEIQAVLLGVEEATAYLDDSENRVLVVHTDSKYVRSGLCRVGFFKKSHVRTATHIFRAAASFKRVYFQWNSATNYGIRNAETQAWKALNRDLGTELTWRGSKGGDYADDPWNPFEGEEGWLS